MNNRLDLTGGVCTSVTFQMPNVSLGRQNELVWCFFFLIKKPTFLSFTLPLSAPFSELPLREAAITTHGRAAAVMSQAISRAPTAATSPTARLSLLSASCSSIALLSTPLFYFNLSPCFHSPSFFHKSYSGMLNVFFFFLWLDEEILQKDSVPCQYLTYFILSIEPFVFACGNGATRGEKNKDGHFP